MGKRRKFRETVDLGPAVVRPEPVRPQAKPEDYAGIDQTFADESLADSTEQADETVTAETLAALADAVYENKNSRRGRK